jgi:hypothetical protein
MKEFTSLDCGQFPRICFLDSNQVIKYKEFDELECK